MLHKVAASEGMMLPESLAARIAEHSEGNLRKALLTMEATKAKKYLTLSFLLTHSHLYPCSFLHSFSAGDCFVLIDCCFVFSLSDTRYPFVDNQSVEKNDWEEYIDQLASFILQEQSPARLLAVRAKLYELLSHCIPASLILKKLAFELCKSIDGPLKLAVSKEAAFYASLFSLSFDRMACIYFYLSCSNHSIPLHAHMIGTPHDPRDKNDLPSRSFCCKVYEHLQALFNGIGRLLICFALICFIPIE